MNALQAATGGQLRPMKAVGDLVDFYGRSVRAALLLVYFMTALVRCANTFDKNL